MPKVRQVTEVKLGLGHLLSLQPAACRWTWMTPGARMGDGRVC